MIFSRSSAKRKEQKGKGKATKQDNLWEMECLQVLYPSSFICWAAQMFVGMFDYFAGGERKTEDDFVAKGKVEGEKSKGSKTGTCLEMEHWADRRMG